MYMRPIQAHSCMFARAPVHACAPASRAHPLLQAIFTHALSRVSQKPKTLQEYKHFEPSNPLNPSPGKNAYFLLKHRHLEAGLFLALPLCAPPYIASPRLSHPSTCTPPFASRISTNTTPDASSIPYSPCPQTHKARLAARAPRETCELGLNDPDIEKTLPANWASMSRKARRAIKGTDEAPHPGV